MRAITTIFPAAPASSPDIQKAAADGIKLFQLVFTLNGSRLRRCCHPVDRRLAPIMTLVTTFDAVATPGDLRDGDALLSAIVRITSTQSKARSFPPAGSQTPDDGHRLHSPVAAIFPAQQATCQRLQTISPTPSLCIIGTSSRSRSRPAMV